MKFKKEITIVLLLVFILFQFLYCGKCDIDKVIERITVDTVYVTKVDTVTVDRPSLFIPKPRVIRVVEDRVVYVENPKDTVGTLKVNEYTGTETLSNGTIDYMILSEGRIFKTRFSLKTDEVHITKTIEKMERINSSGVFVYLGPDFTLGGAISEFNTGIMYVHKNKWNIALNTSYNNLPDIPSPDRINLGFRLGFKIF